MLPNGVVSTWAYNERGWVMEVIHTTATGDVIASARYERSASGEPTRVDREDASAVEIGYDAALRVTSEAYSEDGETIGYDYDVDSNRTSRVTSAGNETYAYLAGALLAAVTMASAPTQAFAYDGAGRATDVRGAALSWDADDHVTALGSQTWAFDAQGRRTRVQGNEHLVASTLGGQGPPSTWLTLDGAGAAHTGYVYAGTRTPLARYDAATGSRVYYLSDAQGSVIGLIGESPTERATIHYDGFGNVRRTAGVAALVEVPTVIGGDFRFQGMWQDADTGLYYVHARLYDSALGRFLSRDSADGVRSTPETMLPYAFARDNPFSWSDPAGRSTLSDVSAAQAVERQIESSYAASSGVRAMAWIRNLHHAIPKFLGGAPGQVLTQAPAYVHRAFHAILRVRLAAIGIPPALRSAAEYAAYFRQNPGALEAAWTEVLTASRQIDLLFGTSFAQAFWAALYSGQLSLVP